MSWLRRHLRSLGLPVLPGRCLFDATVGDVVQGILCEAVAVQGAEPRGADFFISASDIETGSGKGEERGGV
jgi:hypothetical protein